MIAHEDARATASPAGRTVPDEAAGVGAPPAGRKTWVLAKTKVCAVAVVCAKCARRQGLRPKAVHALLKRAARDVPGPGGRRVKLCLTESKCLGPCPKRAVAVATGESLARGRVVLVDPAAAPAAVLAAVFPEFGPRESGSPEFGPNDALAAGRPAKSPPAP